MPTLTPAALPTDWPARYISDVKTEAVTYLQAIRGEWPDPSALIEAAVERLEKKIDVHAYTIESEDSWFDRYERGRLGPELAAALEFYATVIGKALASA